MVESDRKCTSNRVSLRLGFWSAVLIAVLFVVFTVCFVMIAASPPLFVWTDLLGYVDYASSHDLFWQHSARFAMLLFGPLYVILLNCLYDEAAQEKRVLVRIAIGFGLAFAVLSGINYFVQLSAVRLSVMRGELAGLEQVVQANPISVVSAINMLGWTLFLGLSSLFVAPVFTGGKLEKAIGIVFGINGLSCLLGGVGYVLDIPLLVFFTVNFGMGGAVLTAAVLLSVYTRRRLRAGSVG